MVPTASMRTVSPARRIHSPISAAARLCSGDKKEPGELVRLGADRRQRIDHRLRPFADRQRVGCWSRLDPVLDAEADDAGHLGYGHRHLGLRLALDAFGEGGQDRLLVGAAHRQDEGKAELGGVGLVRAR